MRHLTLERWSRGTTWLHRREPRVKLISWLMLLIATGQCRSPYLFALLGTLLGVGVFGARLPVPPFALRLCAVLPFALSFAGIAWLAGEPGRAALLAVRSTLSAGLVLLLVSTTRFEVLLAAMSRVGLPNALLDSIQFVYRYLVVIGEQMARMRTAALARGAGANSVVAMSQVGVLFATAFARSERVHRTLLARGWHGGPLTASFSDRTEPWDWAMLSGCSLLLAATLR
ncbi:MAG TPA: energy-coupling factor transporter transmembrane component T [Bryobacteraceae bacterium]|nr:energy-coupling factor transporter transmembrane component T [Bryobacteraceae bacterium]